MLNKISRELPSFEKYEFAKKSKDYCIVIPIINEGEKFKKQLKRVSQYSKFVDIIIADGGSTDGSTDHTFLKKNKVRALLVKTGPGRLSAQYRMAFAYVADQKYKGVITIDGNGKDDPKSIPDFIKLFEQGYDYIQGSRFIKGGKAINTPFVRTIGIRFILSPILSFGAKKIYTDVTNGHRAYSHSLLTNEELKLFRNIFERYEILFYVTARANRLGLKTIELPVTRAYPDDGSVPTKIKGLAANFDLIKKSIEIVQGKYNP